MAKLNYSLLNTNETILKNDNLMRTTGYGGKAGGRERVDLYKSRFREVQEVVSVQSLIDEGLEVDWELKDKTFLIPSDFSRDELLSLGLQEKHLANTMVLMCLLRISTKYKEVVIREKHPFSRINSVVLSEFLLTLGSGTKNLIKRLTVAGWIDVDNSYQVGIKSKGYRIGRRFKNSKWVAAEWKTSLEKFVPEVLEGGYIARRKDVLYSLWSRACVYFTNWQAMADGPLKEICKRTSEIGRKLTVVRGQALDKEIRLSAVEHIECPSNRRSVRNGWTLEDQIQNYYDSLDYFDGERFSVTCHDERFKFYTYRLFSNVVNLKCEFRQFLRLNGQQLVNIDIQSCQVALLATFYKPEDAAEKEKFVNLICGADIYTHIAGGKLDRKAAKLQMFKVMFDKNGNQKGDICDRFKGEFPILASRIFDDKAAGGYKSVARQMQLRESSIMILGVLKKLLFEDQIECFSIHDSIFCLPEDTKLVEEAIRSFFTDQMGFCPKIKLEGPSRTKYASQLETP